MKIDILTLFPEMFDGFLNTSIIKRAIDHKNVTITLHNIRDYTTNKHNKVDDYPYGGGNGMVLQCQPVIDCLQAIKTEKSFTILLTPQGKTFKQKIAKSLIKHSHLILICGHYEGFDERIRDYVDLELSIGDYVLTGGELSSMVVSDSVIRLLQGVIAKESHEDDSFSHGLLEYPQYTKPLEYDGKKVPDILLSGHHENIRKWRLEKSLEKTYLRRKDLLRNKTLSKEENLILDKIKEKYKK